MLFLKKSFFSLRSSIFVCTIWTLHFISLLYSNVLLCITNASLIFQQHAHTQHIIYLAKLLNILKLVLYFVEFLLTSFNDVFFMRLGNSILYYLFEKFVYFIYLFISQLIYLFTDCAILFGFIPYIGTNLIHKRGIPYRKKMKTKQLKSHLREKSMYLKPKKA